MQFASCASTLRRRPSTVNDGAPCDINGEYSFPTRLTSTIGRFVLCFPDCDIANCHVAQYSLGITGASLVCAYDISISGHVIEDNISIKFKTSRVDSVNFME